MTRRYPDIWRVGDKVRYVESREWGPSRGATGVITKIRDSDIGKPASEYQVFWVKLNPKRPEIYWTIPIEVELVPDPEVEKLEKESS